MGPCPSARRAHISVGRGFCRSFPQGGGSESTPGIVQIATQDLFHLIQEKTDRMFLMRVSYLEIYQEDIRDLLNPENTNMQV